MNCFIRLQLIKAAAEGNYIPILSFHQILPFEQWTCNLCLGLVSQDNDTFSALLIEG